MEKYLGSAHNLGGMASLGISRVGQTVLVSVMSLRYGTSLPSLGSVGEASEKGQWSLPTFLCGRKLSPSSPLHARHFSVTLYTTGAFQLPPQCWSSEGMSLSR